LRKSIMKTIEPMLQKYNKAHENTMLTFVRYPGTNPEADNVHNTLYLVMLPTFKSLILSVAKN